MPIIVLRSPALDADLALALGQHVTGCSALLLPCLDKQMPESSRRHEGLIFGILAARHKVAENTMEDVGKWPAGFGGGYDEYLAVTLQFLKAFPLAGDAKAWVGLAVQAQGENRFLFEGDHDVAFSPVTTHPRSR